MFAEVVAVLPLVAGNDIGALRDLVALYFTCKDFALLIAEQSGHFSVLRHWCSCLREWRCRLERILVAHVKENGTLVRTAVETWWGPNGERRNSPFADEVHTVLAAADRAFNCEDADVACEIDYVLLLRVRLFDSRPCLSLFVPYTHAPEDDDDSDGEDPRVRIKTHLIERRDERRRFMRTGMTEELRVRMIEMYRNTNMW
jgi:hypothetical protein